MSHNATNESFATRLEKLERHNSWLKAALLVVLVLATTALVMGSQAENKAGPIKATSIGLYDLDGKLRGTLSDQGLAFFDAKGMRLWLGVARSKARARGVSSYSFPRKGRRLLFPMPLENSGLRW